MLVDNSSQAIAEITRNFANYGNTSIIFHSAAKIKQISFVIGQTFIDGLESEMSDAIKLLEENAHYITEVI